MTSKFEWCVRFALGTALLGSAAAAVAQDAPAPTTPAPQAAATDPAAVPGEAPPEITPATKTAIEKGLKYLVSVQNRDGSWRTNGSTGGYPTAMTSLAGLALLSAGNTPTQGPYSRNVSSA